MIDKGRSVGWQQGEGNGAEEHASDACMPGAPIRKGDEWLAGFARGGEWDGCLPGPELAAVLAGVGGGEWRCPGAEPDELIGVLRRVAALESWISAVKLAVI